jgi:hypothetical protein
VGQHGGRRVQWRERPSTGVAAGASENNTVRNGILGNGTYARGYLIESQWDGVAPGAGNRVVDTT